MWGRRWNKLQMHCIRKCTLINKLKRMETIIQTVCIVSVHIYYMAEADVPVTHSLTIWFILTLIYSIYSFKRFSQQHVRRERNRKERGENDHGCYVTDPDESTCCVASSFFSIFGWLAIETRDGHHRHGTASHSVSVTAAKWRLFVFWIVNWGLRFFVFE